MNPLASHPAALRDEARRWLCAGRAALRVQVAAARGSVPRGPGAMLLVAADAVAGSIGGGHLEWQAIDHARTWLARTDAASDTPPPADQTLALGPSLGQCCGGSVTLRYRPLNASTLADWPLPPPLLRLQLHGAGHVGAAIVALLAGIDCQVQWVDERDGAFSDAGLDLPPHIVCTHTDAAVAEAARAWPGAMALVMTHRHDLDLAIVETLLRRDDLGPVGLIGSATKRARFVHRLTERGVSPARLDGLICPIGVPGIRDKAPAVVAVAVVAQLLQHAAASNQAPDA